MPEKVFGRDSTFNSLRSFTSPVLSGLRLKHAGISNQLTRICPVLFILSFIIASASFASAYDPADGDLVNSLRAKTRDMNISKENISPDGKILLYMKLTANPNDPDAPEHNELHAMVIESGKELKIKGAKEPIKGIISTPAWSVKGKYAAFTLNRLALAVLEVSKDAVIQKAYLTPENLKLETFDYVQFYTPCFSPDGNKTLFFMTYPGKDAMLVKTMCVINSDGGKLKLNSGPGLPDISSRSWWQDNNTVRFEKEDKTKGTIDYMCVTINRDNSAGAIQNCVPGDVNTDNLGNFRYLENIVTDADLDNDGSPELIKQQHLANEKQVIYCRSGEVYRRIVAEENPDYTYPFLMLTYYETLNTDSGKLLVRYSELAGIDESGRSYERGAMLNLYKFKDMKLQLLKSYFNDSNDAEGLPEDNPSSFFNKYVYEMRPSDDRTRLLLVSQLEDHNILLTNDGEIRKVARDYDVNSGPIKE